MTPVTAEDSQLATPGAARASVGRQGFRGRARAAARMAALAIVAIAIQFVMVTAYA
jgi:hypothetical protein